jgi:YD repeat-containing protein
MGRILLFLCALGLPAGGAAAQWREPYVERVTLADDGLAGPVRSAETRKQFTLAGRSGGPPRPYVQLSRVTYDREGRRREDVVADSGVLVRRLAYTYDDRGRSTGYARLGAGGEVQRVTYSYDAGGRWVARETTGEGAGRESYLRDEAGRLLETVHPDGSRTTNRYDARGRRVEEVRSMADGVVLATTAWEHGPAGAVRETWRDGSGLVRWVHALRHDAEGRLVERTIREENGVRGLAATHMPVPGREVFTYRDGGRMVETESFAPDGAPRGKVVERFDARGRMVERERFGPDGAPEPAESVWLDGAGNVVRTVRGVERWSYDDDRHGNWTRKRWLIAPQGGGEPVETYVETREIAYW